MLTIDKRIKSGTLVLVRGMTGNKWHKVLEVSDKHIKLENAYGGSWQMGHILRFKNRNIK